MAVFMALMAWLMALSPIPSRNESMDISNSSSPGSSEVEDERDLLEEPQNGQEQQTNSKEKKNRKRRSIMWKYFEKVKGTDQVKCNLCQHKFPWHNSTSAHVAHLRTRHGNIVNTCKVASVKKHVIRKLSRPKPVSKERASAISDAIMKVISLDLRPFNSVAGRGFKYLLYVLEPG